METETADPGLSQLAEFRFQLRQFLSFSESCAEAAGVTAQQYQLLQVVELAGASGHSISSVAERLMLRHNSAVELVDRAERAGLVRRVGDAKDQRKSMVMLTDAGRKILKRLVAEHLAQLRSSGGEMLRTLAPLVNDPASLQNG